MQKLSKESIAFTKRISILHFLINQQEITTIDEPLKTNNSFFLNKLHCYKRICQRTIFKCKLPSAYFQEYNAKVNSSI